MTISNTRLLERIDDVSAFLRKRGDYHTTTAHQAYGVLQALEWHPNVLLREELYLPEGSILFASVKTTKSPKGLTPNVEKIPWGTAPDLFDRRLNDYDNWPLAFWRELVQNARDAGATRFDAECVEDNFTDPETGETVRCTRSTFRDNGTGMDKDTLQRAFFRRAGSEKPQGAIGGFGDAKNLILTPWLGYTVRTQDVVARGRHEDVFAPILTDQPFLKGTEVTVWMPLTKTTTPEHAQLLVEQSSLPGAFTINGKRIPEKLPQGHLVREEDITVSGETVGKLQFFHSPKAKRHGIYVRSFGLFMFEYTGFSGEYPGVFIIEVNAPPTRVFTTKRDALSHGSSASYAVGDILTSLATDPRTLLKRQRDKKEIIFVGTGSIEAREGRTAELAADIMSKHQLKRPKANKPVKISKEEARELTSRFEAMLDQLEEEKESSNEPEIPEVQPLSANFDVTMRHTSFVDVAQVVGALKLSAWKPDFFLYQNISPWTMPKNLHPASMALKYHQLLQVWTEISKFLLIQLGMYDQPFGVGWVFDVDIERGAESVVAAMYRRHARHSWLLLNPVVIEMSGSEDDRRFRVERDRFSLADPDSWEQIALLSIHEITHMQGYSYHSDSYATALTYNIKVVFRLAPALKEIVKNARASVRAARQELASTVLTGGAKSKTPSSQGQAVDLQALEAVLRDKDLETAIDDQGLWAWRFDQAPLLNIPSDGTEVRRRGLWHGHRENERIAGIGSSNWDWPANPNELAALMKDWLDRFSVPRHGATE